MVQVDVNLALASVDRRPLVDAVVADLVLEFGDRVDRAGVAECVRSTHSAFAEARVTQYLPILVRREARARLLRMIG